jgi:UDP-N-acetylmuramoyl-tripeptide--D-alanyl-D-alanine ligase
LVIEMGMRGPGEIERLSRCTEPDVAVITNIGTAHIGRLGSREAIAAAKCEITAALKPDGVVVIPAGDALLETALSKVWSGRVVRVRLADDTPVAADCIGAIDAGHLEVGAHRLPLPLEGRHNARNVLLALAVADQLGVDSASLNAMEVSVPGGRNRRLVQGDSPFSMRPTTPPLKRSWPALALLSSQPGRRFAVLGTMLELGAQSLQLHGDVAAQAAALKLDGLVVVDGGAEGRAMAHAAAGLPRLAVVSSPEDAAKPLKEWLRAGDVVLLKASRGVALERLLPLLPSF